MTVDIHFRGVADHKTLQATRLLVQAWQPDQLAFDVFPVGIRVNQQAIVPVYGCDELTLATRSDPLPITGRYRQTPLGVQSDLGCPTKHGSFDGYCARTDRANSALTHLLPLFSTFQHYIDGALQRQQGIQLILVLQGLRVYGVAMRGRIVAALRSAKSKAYVAYLEFC